MAAYIVTIGVGIICIILGISHTKGNISSLHSYHRHRVTEADRLPFGKLVGIGTIIMGLSVIFLGVFLFLADLLANTLFVIIGTVGMIVGFALGLGISFYAMIKYNKGIF